MSHMKTIIFALLSIFFFINNTNAQGTDESIHRLGIVVNQDYFLKFVKPGLNQDRNYTMGAALPVFQYAKMGEKGWVYAPHRFLAKSILGKSAGNYKLTDATVMLANTTFTPLYLGNLHDPESEYKRKNDRPFSSLNFIGTSFGVQKDSGNELLSVEINVGAIGLDVSKAFQTTVHRDHWFGTVADIPYGWEDQISEGGEPTLLVSGKYDWLIVGKSDGSGNNKGNFQLSANTEVRLGYYVNGSAGINTRIGLLDKRNWGMNTLPLSSGYSILSPQKNPFELFFMGGVKGNSWLYNALLMGQFRQSPYALSFKQLNKFTMEWNLGVGTKIPFCKNRAIRASVMAVGRSPEFSTVKAFERWHSWADLQLYYEW